MKVSLPQRNKLAQSMLWNLFLLTVGAVFFLSARRLWLRITASLTGDFRCRSARLVYDRAVYARDLVPADQYTVVLRVVVPNQAPIFFYSLYGSLATTIISELITFQVPIQDHFYAAITAGVLCGTGTGLMLRTLGSGGGLDLIGVILNKRWNIGIGRFNFCFNAVMFLASMATISLGDGHRVVHSGFRGFRDYRIRAPVWAARGRWSTWSPIGAGALCEAIIAEGYGGATVLKAQGAYSGGDRGSSLP